MSDYNNPILTLEIYYSVQCLSEQISK